MESASHFRQKAQQCRRLAAAILTREDATSDSLMPLAADFEAAAAVIDARSDGTEPIGHGYNDGAEDASPPLRS